MARPKNPPPPQDEQDPWNQESTKSHVINQLGVELPQRHTTLELISGPGSPRTFSLGGAELVLGRAPDCELRIDSQEISRKHMKLVRKETEYLCEDLGSRNGIYLNGIKVHSALLRDEDRIQVGDAIFVYREGS